MISPEHNDPELKTVFDEVREDVSEARLDEPLHKEEMYKRQAEVSLAKMDLSMNVILSRDLPALKESLMKIDKYIVYEQRTARAGRVSSTYRLPVLIDRQKLILDRIREIESSQEINQIVISAKEDSTNLKQEIEKLMSMNEKWLSISNENEQARKEAEALANQKTQEMLLRQEERAAFKERWAIWQSILEKESVSTIVGAFLLIIITFCQIIASFTHITTTQILDNGFLVILGYFFGQTVARASSRQKD